VDLNSILTEIAARIRPIVSDRFVLRTQLDPNLACIQADPKQMDWLFVNLAADAYDGMRSGGELVITTANVELNPSSGREMKLPPGQYVQVEFSVTSGLLEVKPTIRNILQRIQGAIAVRGTSGTGMVCDILLPRASEAVPPAAVEQQRKRDRSGPVVLMVSGDSATRALSSDLLRDAGYHVLEAAHGLEAETVLAAGQVDLMIADIVMPEQDGLETILSLRAIYPGLKIIAVAESDAGSELRTAKLFGADSVMSKPLMRSILCAAVYDQIGGAGSSTDAV
jgi:two-component system, cell cycle sensor histidine kinase and response regulator CckA